MSLKYRLSTKYYKVFKIADVELNKVLNLTIEQFVKQMNCSIKLSITQTSNNSTPKFITNPNKNNFSVKVIKHIKIENYHQYDLLIYIEVSREKDDLKTETFLINEIYNVFNKVAIPIGYEPL